VEQKQQTKFSTRQQMCTTDEKALITYTNFKGFANISEQRNRIFSPNEVLY